MVGILLCTATPDKVNLNAKHRTQLHSMFQPAFGITEMMQDRAIVTRE